MKVKASCLPSTDCEKLIEWTMNINVILYVKRLATEVAVDAWGEEWKDCVVWISDRNKSFPVKQGVLMHDQGEPTSK